MWKFILLLTVCASVQAETTSSKDKAAIYGNCLPTCVAKQKSNPSSKGFLDVPFVMESFCSCHCTRMAMRISMNQVELIGRLALEGKEANEIPWLKKISDRNMTLCGGALFTN